MSEHTPSAVDKPSIVDTKVDPELARVAHLHKCLEESENGFTFIGYASDPRQSSPHWIIHIMDNGRLRREIVVARLDIGSEYSHNDMTLLFKEVDKQKRIFNDRIDIPPSI